MKRIVILLLALSFANTTKAQVGTCEQADAEAFLDVNNVRARIFNNGALFWSGSPHVYEVPKYGGSNALFSAGIWIGGKVNNELRMAASTYGPWEFWPGPLDDAGSPPDDCAQYDRIYSVYLRDISAFESTGEISKDLADWPWELGAPVVDGDGNPDNYNLAGGDRPEIKGHQTLWWVMNDRGNTHERTDTDAIGLEIQVTAFAASSDSAFVDNATLYHYKIIYKGDLPLTDTYFGVFNDADLGNFDDDYVGSDSLLSLAYTYNSDNFDEGSGGYGDAPPAVGFDLLSGPLADDDGIDNDQDGEIDEPEERRAMTSFFYFNGGGGVTGDPSPAIDFYNYLQGNWKDGMPFTFGGNGRDFSNIPTPYVFSGDPVTGEGWSELNPAADGSIPPISPADRRSGFSSGPFTMQPGDEQSLTFAIVWARGSDHLDSVTELKSASAKIQSLFDNGFDVPPPSTEPLSAPTLSAPANGVGAQPTDPTLQWQALDNPTQFELQWSTDATFTVARLDTLSLQPSQRIEGLQSFTTYYWRVRPLDAGQLGPWSETWSFTTGEQAFGTATSSNFAFMAVQNAAGPIEPPDMAAFAFNGSGFPHLEGRVTPMGSHPFPDRPTREVQQANSNATWGIHAGVSESIRVTLFDDANEPSFLGQVFRNDAANISSDAFEWRFPQSCLDQMNGIIEEGDCLANRAFEDAVNIEVPFELWNIGDEADPGDDYRMIPFVCEAACGAGTESMVFDIANDHPISGGDNDPFTDWVFWNNPADNGAEPGEQGYLDYFFVGTDAGEEVMANMVLVQWNGGSEPPFETDLPEPGTIFRIITDLKIPPPLHAAPVNNTILSSQSTTLFWNANPNMYYELQIDTAPDFANPDLTLTGLSNMFYEATDLPKNNTYYWRVRMASQSGFEASDWSEAWQFTIPLNVSTDEVSGIQTFSLEQSYPNPFQSDTRIRYALPEATEVHLAIFDTLGRRVRILVNGQQSAGWHEALFNATGLSNGMYFYRLTAGSFTDTKSMILLK